MALRSTAKDLDSADRRILRELQKDGRISIVDLADRVGLTQTPCWRRIHSLEQRGVIRESPDLIAAFKDRMRAAPEVQQCYYVTGDADFVLVVTAPDVGNYESIVDRLFNDRSIRKFKTAVVISRVKATLAVTIECP